jgi:hypothetical protein
MFGNGLLNLGIAAGKITFAARVWKQEHPV